MAFAVVFAPLATAQKLAGQPGRVNQLVLRLRPGADAAAAERDLRRALEQALPDTGFTVTHRDQEPAHRLIYKDAEGDQEMLDIFAFLLLGAATFAAFNLISRTVESQRQRPGVARQGPAAPGRQPRQPPAAQRPAHPAPQPDDAARPGTFRLVRSTLPVTGIHTSPLRFLAYASSPAAADLHLSGLVNRISVVPARNRNGDDIKSELMRLPTIAAVQGATATTDAVDQRLEQFNQVLLVTVMIAAAMALLIAFNATSINAEERAREHATMFAYGVTVGRVTRGNIAEALAIGALGTAVGIAAAGTLVVAAAPLLTLRRLRHTDISATSRVVE